MFLSKKIKEDIYWIGGNDRRLALFENNYPIPRGVSYNSYLIRDEKNVLLDTANSTVDSVFFQNLEQTLGGEDLDYLVIHHMEPDHAGLSAEVLERYPNAKVILNAKTLVFLKQFSNIDFIDRAVIVKDGETVSFGKHSLTFVFAPMVHWPEVMVSYDACDKILFSADGFGTFGALDGALYADQVDFKNEWLDDARRYYTNICGKYGPQVQTLLMKASTLDIEMICPLHGPIWREDLGWFIEKYQTWSSYTPEAKEVSIFYGSMYNNTQQAAEALSGMLIERGVRSKCFDVAATHYSDLVSEAFRVSHIVLAAPTYNNGLYTQMANLLHDLKEHNLQNRKFAIIENGTWALQAGKIMRASLEGMKKTEIIGETFSIKSAMKPEQYAELEALADVIAESVKA